MDRLPQVGEIVQHPECEPTEPYDVIRGTKTTSRVTEVKGTISVYTDYPIAPDVAWSIHHLSEPDDPFAAFVLQARKEAGVAVQSGG